MSKTPRTDALALAIKFHDCYERLAPSFCYETRADTRKFDPESPNGRLMIAVIEEAFVRDLAAALEENRNLVRIIEDEKSMVPSLQSENCALLERAERAEADSAAVRELMNAYNLGGWTDAIGPMKRALKAEAERDAAVKDGANLRGECSVLADILRDAYAVIENVEGENSDEEDRLWGIRHMITTALAGYSGREITESCLISDKEIPNDF